MEILKLPVGIDNFEKIRRNNFDAGRIIFASRNRKFAYLYHKTKTLWKNSRYEHVALIF